MKKPLALFLATQCSDCWVEGRSHLPKTTPPTRSKSSTEPRGASLAGVVSLAPGSEHSGHALRFPAHAASAGGARATAWSLGGGSDPPIFIGAESLGGGDCTPGFTEIRRSWSSRTPSSAAGGVQGPGAAGEQRAVPLSAAARGAWRRAAGTWRGRGGRTRPSGRAGPAPTPPSRTSRLETCELHAGAAAALPGRHR